VEKFPSCVFFGWCFQVLFAIVGEKFLSSRVTRVINMSDKPLVSIVQQKKIVNFNEIVSPSNNFVLNHYAIIIVVVASSFGAFKSLKSFD
jgi:hypothetical protein